MALYSDRRTIAQPRAGVDAQYDAGLRNYMLRVYNYMASGLVLSGLMAVMVAYTPAVQQLFFAYSGGRLGLTGLGTALMFAPLAMILFANFAGNNWSTATTKIFYWLFVAVNGAGLSVLLLLYTASSAAFAFFLTAAAFGGLSLYGYTTKRDLSGWAKFLFMAVWGLLIVSLAYVVANLIFGLNIPGLMYALSLASILIFSGIIAWKTQDMRQEYYMTQGSEVQDRVAVWSALTLYIAFIAIFQNLMYLLGQNR